MIRFVPIVALVGGTVLACQPDTINYTPTPTIAWSYAPIDAECIRKDHPYDCCTDYKRGCSHIDGFFIYAVDCEECGRPIGFNFTVTADSEETVGEDGAASNAVDGHADTIWHTAWTPDPTPDFPHWLEIDMGRIRSVCGVDYRPRPEGSDNGTIQDYMIWVSDDGIGETLASSSRYVNQEYRDVFAREHQARWIRYEALTEINDQPFASAAEITPLEGRCDETIQVASDGFYMAQVGPLTREVAVQKWITNPRRFVNFAVAAFVVTVETGGIETIQVGGLTYIDEPICMPDICEAQTQTQYRECFE